MILRLRIAPRFAVFPFAAAVAVLLPSCKTPPLPRVHSAQPVLYTITINGNVPYIVGEAELNSLIKTRSVERYQEFEEAVKTIGVRIDNAEDTGNAGGIKELIFNLGWKAGRRDWDVVSMVIFVTWNIDENYTLSGAESFTWDVNHKKLLSAQNILQYTKFNSLDSLSAFANRSLREKLDPQNVDPALQKIIDRDTAPIPENYSVFLLEKEGITFYFNTLGCDLFVSL
ncbi:MAG: hypothetical protein Pg6C_15340 [Treponemataceae bacterium]|nr:MAG: hypothetical protein Pg6C_15340 [Treponemataceae bacterium]